MFLGGRVWCWCSCTLDTSSSWSEFCIFMLLKGFMFNQASWIPHHHKKLSVCGGRGVWGCGGGGGTRTLAPVSCWVYPTAHLVALHEKNESPAGGECLTHAGRTDVVSCRLKCGAVVVNFFKIKTTATYIFWWDKRAVYQNHLTLSRYQACHYYDIIPSLKLFEMMILHSSLQQQQKKQFIYSPFSTVWLVLFYPSLSRCA